MGNDTNKAGYTGLELAIIGMSIKLPGAANYEEFWNNLKEGVESVSFSTAEEIAGSREASMLSKNKNFVPCKGGLLSDKAYFDAAFFGYNPKEAELLDPQIRIFHEVAWTALEDAGYSPLAYKGRIGVFAGATSSYYWEVLTEASGKLMEFGGFEGGQLNTKDSMAKLLSYRLNLTGPSLTLHTNCSTSLVAIHLASRSLLLGECEMAIAGGVGINYTNELGYLYQDGMITSRDGHCKAFDAAATGAIGGEGCGVILLKPLKKALADGDHIHAIIKGSAINNDGNLKVGYTAPSIQGQHAAIRSALAFGKVDPADVTYVETHGTGTRLGDIIEVEALKKAYGHNRQTPWAIGSVKTNVGHLDAAAGIAGLIKTVLCLQHKMLVPSLHFKQPNPELEMEGSSMYVNNELREWTSQKGPLRAGVSSFGIGGTNAHVILEEAPAVNIPVAEKSSRLLTISARSAEALDMYTTQLTTFLKQHPDVNPDHLAYTLQTGRTTFPYRRTILCSSIAEAVTRLESGDSDAVNTFNALSDKKKAVFLFPGQGAQYVNMARGLYDSNKFFAQEIDKCAAIIDQIRGNKILDILFGKEEDVEATIHAQPLLFMVEYALARLMIRWIGAPVAMIGHSLGEIVAACIAGVMGLEEALKIVVFRGRIMQQMPHGAMLSVLVAEQELRGLLNGYMLDVAAVNTHDLCVVAGEEEEIEAFESMLGAIGYPSARLPTSHASHSAMMKSVVAEFEIFLNDIELKEPEIPFISSISGNWIDNEAATSAQYWSQHILATVRFKDGVDVLLKNEQSIFLEVGPGNTLSAFIRGHQSRKPSQHIVNLLRHPKDDVPDEIYWLDKIAELWLYGMEINWAAGYEDIEVKRIPLPTYPFERKRYWIDENPFELFTAGLTDRRLPIGDCFNYPAWQQGLLHGTPLDEELTWIIFTTDLLLTASLVSPAARCIGIFEGEKFREGKDGTLEINPTSSADWEKMITWINSQGIQKIGFLYDWPFNRGYYDLFYLCKAINRLKSHHNIPLKVLVEDAHRINGNERICPEKSAMVAALKVIQQEFPSLSCQLIDIDGKFPATCRAIRSELGMISKDRVVAIRNGLRWTLGFRKVKIDRAPASAYVKQGGTYIITGGTGTVGLGHAAFLLDYPDTKVVILGRRQLSLRESAAGSGTKEKELAAAFHRLDPTGSRLYYAQADVADKASLKYCLEDCVGKFGAISGIIHAAGLSNDKSTETGILSMTEKDIATQFNAKVKGWMNLASITEEIPTEFVLATSSLASFLGGVGFYAYAAANAMLDTLVLLENEKGKTRWITVNWDGWSETPEDGLLDEAEAKEALSWILSDTGLNQVVVSMTNLDARLEKWINTDFSAANTTTAVNTSTGDDRPEMVVPYKAPVSDLQKALAEIWTEAFGYTKIGINDNFFELGGNSLKMLMMIAKIQKKLSANVPVDFFFKHPTIALVSEYIGKDGTIIYRGIPIAEKKEYYHVSSAQHKQFVLQQMNDGSTAYNESQIFKVTGKIDAAAIERAINVILERHEVLRTRIYLMGEQPVQQVMEKQYFSISRKAISNQEIAAQVSDFIRPFDMEQPPFLRIGLFDLEEEDNVAILAIDMHHLITDEVSFGNFVRELQVLLSSGTLPPLEIQYKDYATWQHTMVREGGMEPHRRFWLETFAGILPVIDLPYDFPRPPVKTFVGDRISFSLTPEENQSILAFCEERGCTLYMFTLAVYAILLAKLSGSDDVILGSPTSGRSRLETQDMIGMFVNTLALRLQPNEEDNFSAFLEQVKETVLHVFEHQDYPFEQLVDDLFISRNAGRTPLFDVWFVLQNVEGEELRLHELQFEPFDYNYASAKWDLTLQVNQDKAHIDFMIEYNVRLFRKETAEAFSAYYLKMLREILSNGDIRIGAINPLERSFTRKLSEATQRELNNLSF